MLAQFNDIYMHHQCPGTQICATKVEPALVQVKAYRLSVAKSLPEPMTFCANDTDFNELIKLIFFHRNILMELKMKKINK